MARPNYTDPTCVEPITVGVCRICGYIDERPDALCHGYPGREPSEGHEQIDLTPVEIMPRRWALDADEARAVLRMGRSQYGVDRELRDRAEVMLNRLAAGGDLTARVMAAVASAEPAPATHTGVVEMLEIDDPRVVSCELHALTDEGELTFVGGSRWIRAGVRREETITLRPGFEVGDMVRGTLSSGSIVEGPVASIEYRAFSRGSQAPSENVAITYGVSVRSSTPAVDGRDGPSVGTEVRLGETQLITIEEAN